jgi:hypothetical protein
LQSTGRGREVTVTNDGATILKSLHIDNPAAKVLVGILAFVLLLDDMARDCHGWRILFFFFLLMIIDLFDV